MTPTTSSRTDLPRVVPELPEVEVVRRGLADHVLGRTVTDVELRGHRVARRHVAGPQDLTDRLSRRIGEGPGISPSTHAAFRKLVCTHSVNASR